MKLAHLHAREYGNWQYGIEDDCNIDPDDDEHGGGDDDDAVDHDGDDHNHTD